MTKEQEQLLREVVSRYKQGATDGTYSHKLGDSAQIEKTGGELEALGYVVLKAGDASVPYKRIMATNTGVQWVDDDNATKAQTEAQRQALETAQRQSWKDEITLLESDFQTAYDNWNAMLATNKVEMAKKLIRYLKLKKDLGR